MAFQTATSPSSGSYREILTRLVAFATSQHVSAVAVNAGGTGYTVGDLLTITHAGAYGDCLLEVTAESSGVITAVAIRAAGAFSNRVASATVAAGGTGYNTGEVVELTTGTFTEPAKMTVTAAAGVVSAVALFETGGAYTVVPTASGATDSAPGEGTGTGLTVTPTMTGLIGTTGIAATGGTGASATFDLTLTATGHSTLLNANNFAFNSLTDEKEVILQGTVAGGDAPIVGFRSYTTTVGPDTIYGWGMSGMDSFNGALAFNDQPNIGPNTDITSNLGPCFLLFDDDQEYWFNVTGRRLIAVVKAVGASITSYTSMYSGLLNPFGTQVESPYPLYLSGTSTSYQRPPDNGGNFVTGLTEVFADTAGLSPAFFRKQSDGTWTQVVNSANDAASSANVVYPVGSVQLATAVAGEDDDICGAGQFAFGVGLTGISIAAGTPATQIMMPTISDDEIVGVPTVVMSGQSNLNDANTIIRGELDQVKWIPGTKADGTVVSAEDTITFSGVRYMIFQNAHRTQRYSFFALATE